MTKILGIDEAGRGPIIGPLVMAAVMMEEKELFQLDRLGVKDSKLLAPQQRSMLFTKITEICKHTILVITPDEIDEALKSDHNNLNWLEAQKSAEMINSLAPDTAIVDCPSNNIEAYSAYLKNLLKNKKIKLLAEHKADYNHKIVGAASILAKVTRDKEIEKLQEVIPVPIGSGYPSDPITQAFVTKYYKEYGHIMRKSWETYKSLERERTQSKLDTYNNNL